MVRLVCFEAYPTDRVRKGMTQAWLDLCFCASFDIFLRRLRNLVAQTFSLLYRRFSIGGSPDASRARGVSKACGLQIRDTAVGNSALLCCGFAAGSICGFLLHRFGL